MRWGYALVCAVLLAATVAGACAPAGPAAPPGPPSTGGASGQAAPQAAGPAAGAAGVQPTAVVPLAQKVNAAYASLSASFTPMYVATEAGLFAKHGLDVEMSYIASGTTATQSLIAGDIHFISTSGAEPAIAYVRGAPAQVVLAWIPTLPSLFMVDPSITSPEQLRGKTLGITRFGGQPHVGARLALKKWGLNPDTDVQWQQLGEVQGILAGMQQGIVVGGSFSPPTNVQARRLGFRMLGDLAQMDIPYQSSVLVGMQPYVEANSEVVRRFARAIVEAIKVSLTDEATTRAALGRVTRLDDAELLDEALDYYRRVVARSPYPAPEGLQTVLDDLAEQEPGVRSIRPQEFINTAALEQIDREGFLRQVWGE
jgi:NitT/TauT family transport system substrate-binding protein